MIWIFLSMLSFRAAWGEDTQLAPYMKCVSGIIGVVKNQTPIDEKFLATNAEMLQRHRAYRYFQGHVEECDTLGITQAKLSYDALKSCRPPASTKNAREVLRDGIDDLLSQLAAASTRDGFRPVPHDVSVVLNQCSELDDPGDLPGKIKNVRAIYHIPLEQTASKGVNTSG